MATSINALLFLSAFLHTCGKSSQSEVEVTYYNYPKEWALKWNGSSLNGHCTDVQSSDVKFGCGTPSSSVLFDGEIPTLTGLDGDTWASPLMILQASLMSGYEMTFRFAKSTVRRIEIVALHCPQWGSYISTVSVSSSHYTKTVYNTLGTDICGSLLKICIPINIVTSEIAIDFVHTERWIHLAEVTFFDNIDAPCDMYSIATKIHQPSVADPNVSILVVAVLQTVVITLVFLVLLVLLVFACRRATPKAVEFVGARGEDDQDENDCEKNELLKESSYAV